MPAGLAVAATGLGTIESGPDWHKRTSIGVDVMKRVLPSVLVALGLALLVPPAWASDATLKSALKPYEARLTKDIAYLAGFRVPSKKATGGALKRLAKINKDLKGAVQAANHNQASSKNGRKGRSLVLSGLHDAIAAAGAARSCAKAAKAGHHAAAKLDRKHEQREINRAIPELESGGKLLHLF